MESMRISLARAKAKLSEITRLAAAGETVIITRRGKPLAQISRARQQPRPIDLGALRRLTDSMGTPGEDSGDFTRRMRDQARY